MFKKKKKEFPPGTFIPTPARVVAIIQLCLAFTAMMWSMGHPFMGDLFAVKSKLLVYEEVIRDSARFALLPATQQEQIKEDYASLQKKTDIPFATKLERSFSILAWETPSFELAWIFFSVVISLMLLMRIEGALHAVWLLPLIVAAYAINNQLNGVPPQMTPEARLFPTEEHLVHSYIPGGLNPNIMEQREQLLRAWKTYLVVEWAHERPSDDEVAFNQQVDTGAYAFSVARLEALPKEQKTTDPSFLHKKDSIFILALYFLWNLFFAWYVNKKYVPCA